MDCDHEVSLVSGFLVERALPPSFLNDLMATVEPPNDRHVGRRFLYMYVVERLLLPRMLSSTLLHNNYCHHTVWVHAECGKATLPELVRFIQV